MSELTVISIQNIISVQNKDKECCCGDPTLVAPDGHTMRHRPDLPCYVQPHDERFLAVWNVIKNWDVERILGDGYSFTTGDDVCAILEALDGISNENQMML